MYHDAAEDPNVLEAAENTREAAFSHGGCGSSSLRECIELLNNPQRKSPATCHSGPKMENRSGPPHSLCFSLAFIGLPLFQFLFLCLPLSLSLSLSLSWFFLSFFLLVFFLPSFRSLFFSLSFLFFLLCFCFMKGTTSKH